ncbi:Lrp/AsnC family transcriptional regulator [Brachybacterium nesterenkovii]|uniref:Transcriptional regulator, AsnC family n=1 Tax=Brachybacterium nesterenkovii TaxID=47847 RepID=A0A1X6WVG6_9MICO|nr:Lrp/AsnC ligand binding domain-containing protein [Brachybacterium nesterenkovii]SLM89389.1 Transcriptional regulator, AsnC family [Brachybacterium nesterenkovii]
MITALASIIVDSSRIPEVAQEIADIPGVETVYSVTGDVDLVAIVTVRRHEEFAGVIADRIGKVEGVLDTTTNIAFAAYSARDLGEGFSLGEDPAAG